MIEEAEGKVAVPQPLKDPSVTPHPPLIIVYGVFAAGHLIIVSFRVFKGGFGSKKVAPPDGLEPSTFGLTASAREAACLLIRCSTG